LLFGACCVIWGIPYLFIRVAVRDLSPAALVFGRTAIAALLLLPLALRRGSVGPLRARWRPVVVFAAVEIGVPWLLLAHAEERLTSSLTALLIATVPLIGVVLSRRVKGSEQLDRRALGGLLLGLAGVAALVGLSTGGATAGSVGEVGVVAACYAAGPIVLDRYLSDLPALGVIAVSLALCALAYAPATAIGLRRETIGGDALGSVLVLAVVCTALAFVLFFELIATIGPVRATVITYVNPAVAALLGVLVLAEPFTLGMAIGFALILAGSAFATRRASPAG
jgi:drug/metabolite transporter (DMT)-like permease